MSDAQAFERCVARGGVVVFPADTVYGLACDPENAAAVKRLYRLKNRSLDKPSAVMFFDLDAALAELPELGERTIQGMRRLLPSGVTLLVANPARRFPLACGDDPDTLGIRVPHVDALAGTRVPVLQSSANLAGELDARRLDEVPKAIRGGADLLIDGGELPGTPSTVVDLRSYDGDGPWQILREGAVEKEELEWALGGQFHFRPETYESEIVADMPGYHELQRQLVEASGTGARRILELGTGTGITAELLLDRHPGSHLVGVDMSPVMLEAARARLPPGQVELRVGPIEGELPAEEFDLVASALAIHHLDSGQKAELFKRLRACLAPGGRFVLGDLVVPDDPAQATTPSTPGFDKPSSVEEQLRWLDDAGFVAEVRWEQGDLAVISATAGPN